jgi:alpha-tubulin suppressor-like RCC1 family protein
MTRYAGGFEGEGLTGVRQVVADRGDHTCAVKQDGSLWCWGRNTWGPLGDGVPRVTGVPAPVVGY